MAVFYESKYMVEESVLERHPRTGVVREIDIRITSRSNPEDRLLVECRAHKRRQDVQWIDALDGKGRSLGFPKIVAVSASGFTKSALIEAHDRGIDTLHLKEADEVDWRKWFMAIPELGIEVTSPVLRSVDFGVDANWPGTLPDSMDLLDVILVDTRDSTRIPLLEWIAGLLNDPEQVTQLQALAENGNVTDLHKVHHCAPEMGFILNGQEEFIPLVQVVVHVDINISHDSIPLKHLDVGGQRILVGESQIRGIPTRVVMHEKGKELTMLYEQNRPKNEGEC
jgi:hypothetical protein